MAEQINDQDKPSPRPTAKAVPVVEGYRITGRLGEGGMGIVWAAEQLGTRRLVALKLLSVSSFASERSKARFVREVELAASLQHPNIARVYDSGLHRGVYFYAMEHVPGLPLDKYVTANQLGLDEVIELLRQVCMAVQHAHQRGIIHRDLKPSNILVTPDGQPHILDFGLAKGSAEGDAATAISLDGAIAGTPAYMSPEQASGRSDIDTRSDVYTLGVILYRLVIGKSPHDLSGTYLNVLRRIAEGDPISPRKVRSQIDADLEAILLKVLARDRDQRYSSLSEFAADLGRYLADEVTLASPASAAQHFQRWVSRHRGRVIATTAAMAIITTAAVYFNVENLLEKNRALHDKIEIKEALSKGEFERFRASLAEAKERKAVVEANKERDEARAAQTSEKMEREKENASAESERKANEQLEIELADSTISRGESAVRDNRNAVALKNYEQAAEDLRKHGGSLLHYAMAKSELAEHSALPLWKIPSELPQAAGGTIGCFTGDEEGVVIACPGKIVVRNCLTGALITQTPLNSGEVIASLASVPGTGSIRAATMSGDVIEFNAETLQRGTVWNFPDAKGTPKLSSDGTRIGFPSQDRKTYNICDVSGKQRRAVTVNGSPFQTSGDLSHLVTWADESLRMYGAEGAKPLYDFRTDEHPGVRFVTSECGTYTLFSDDNSPRLQVVKTGGQTGPLFTGHHLPPRCYAFTRDDGLVISDAGEGELRVWDPATGVQQLSLLQKGEIETIKSLEVSPDRRLVLAITNSGAVLVWPLHGSSARKQISTKYGWNARCAISRNGKRLILQDGKAVKLCNLSTGSVLLDDSLDDNGALCLSPDDNWAFLLDESGLKIWNRNGRQKLIVQTVAVDASEKLCSMRVTDDGSTLIAVSDAAKIHNIQLNDQLDHKILQPAVPTDGNVCTAISGTGICAVGCDSAGEAGNTITLVDSRDGKIINSAKSSLNGICSFSFSQDGKRLAVGSARGPVAVFTVPELVLVWSNADVHDSKVHAIAFTCDDRLVVSAGADQRTCFLDANNEGRQVCEMAGGPASICSTPNGRTIFFGEGTMDGVRAHLLSDYFSADEPPGPATAPAASTAPAPFAPNLQLAKALPTHDTLPDMSVEQIKEHIANLENRRQLNPDQFDFDLCNDLRHYYWYDGQTESSLKECDTVFRNVLMNEYMFDCIGGTSNIYGAAACYLEWPARYPDLKYLSAACWIKAASLEKDPYYAAVDLHRVLKLEGPDLEPYKKLALERLSAVKQPHFLAANPATAPVLPVVPVAVAPVVPPAPPPTAAAAEVNPNTSAEAERVFGEAGSDPRVRDAGQLRRLVSAAQRGFAASGATDLGITQSSDKTRDACVGAIMAVNLREDPNASNRDRDAAAEALCRAMKRLDLALGQGNPTAVIVRGQYAFSLWKQGKVREAETNLRVPLKARMDAKDWGDGTLSLRDQLLTFLAATNREAEAYKEAKIYSPALRHLPTNGYSDAARAHEVLAATAKADPSDLHLFCNAVDIATDIDWDPQSFTPKDRQLMRNAALLAYKQPDSSVVRLDHAANMFARTILIRQQ